VGIPEDLRAELDDPRVVFVFPTEVAARSWLRRAFRLTPRRALPADRFLSWDQFAERALDYGDRGRPATPAARALFAAGMLAENRRRRVFRQLVPEAAAAEPLAFLPMLRDLLPHLHQLDRLPGEWPSFSAGKLADLRLLAREYRLFLQRAKLFEPSFHEPTVRAQAKAYRLFYPEVLEEFPALERRLAACPQITIVHLPPADPSACPPLTAWEDCRQEIAWVLTRVAELLDAGTEPAEVALTVADLPALEAPLRRQAELLEVPLAIHRRRPLAEYPPCRVFDRIRVSVETGFSLPALRDLLLDRSLPWREEELGRALIGLGTELRVHDRWEQAFLLAGRRGRPPAVDRLRAHFRRLQAELSEIAGAPDFRRLKERLTRFSKSLLDATRWRREELDAYQFALTTLDPLAEALPFTAGLPDSAFLTWLACLKLASYGPQVTEAGVAVHAFPVSAGIAVEHHFVIGVSQEATRHPLKLLPFLGAHEEQALGLAGRELDLAEARLRLYSLSGRSVRFSYARRDPGRSHLPAGFFVSSRAVRAAEPALRPDPYAVEAAAWAGTGSLLPPLLPVQEEGFRRARPTALTPKAWDAAAEQLADPALLAGVLGRLRDPSGLLRLSPTGMELYCGCPFRFLLEKALGLAEEEDSPVAVEPREFGSLMHRVLQRFGRRVQQEEPDSRLDPAQAERYAGWLRGIVHRVFRDWARERPVPVEPARRRALRRALELAERFIERELAELAGTRFVDTEHYARRELAEAGVLLHGSIDRISADEQGYLLIDYKKNTTPTAAQIFAEEPTSLQMPFYLELLAGEGLEVHAAAFYSIEQGKYRWVFADRRTASRPMADGEAMAEARAALRRRAAGVAAALAAGDFTIPPRPACDSCGQRPVCRHRYAVLSR